MQDSHKFPAAALRHRFIGGLAILLLAGAAQAAAPGIMGGASSPVFDLVASAGNTTQPDGASIYTWGYGCNSATTPTFVPQAIGNARCGQMQLPGPTLIVYKGDKVTVTLHNNLPAAAGNTSILFPGFKVCAATLDSMTGACTGTATGTPGLLTQEAAHGGTVTYTFMADVEGTHSYHSGTQGDLQVEMGMYGALIVLPSSKAQSAACATTPVTAAQGFDRGSGPPQDFRLPPYTGGWPYAAFDQASSCYDREYLFQTSEMDPRIHEQAAAQAGVACNSPAGCMNVETEPYHPAYFLLNGRSMPDTIDPNFSPQYPNQPYNANPHMHPGEIVLLRIIGQGRLQHPFHEHANHVRVLARDGQMLLNVNGKLSGPLLFTTTTSPGQAIDGLFQFTGKNLNWDIYGHGVGIAASGGDAEINPATDCDANGYFTNGLAYQANNFFEWCGDHQKPLESKPFGNVGSGGPVTLPDPNILTNGPWYSGSPYLGPDANLRSVGPTPIPPFGTIANSPSGEAGFAFMWHSHNEREITTNNIFPGGLMTMMLVDPWVFLIDESK